MSSPKTARELLDREFLEIRARLLETAASLDRIERADSSDLDPHDERLGLLRRGLEILLEDGFHRAERIQLLFSDEYVPNWSH
jgi:hypothetical protein